MQGTRAARLSFPTYTTPVLGSLVQNLLRGAYGAVDPQLSALVFAANRAESRATVEDYLHNYDVVIVDRWVPSNQAYQGARVSASQQQAFVEWVAQLEYELLGARTPDLVLYFRGDPSFALGAAKLRAQSSGSRPDIYESDRSFLSDVHEVYERLAAKNEWLTIDVLDDERKSFRSADHISDDILRAIKS
jgi:dTMP kinase